MTGGDPRSVVVVGSGIAGLRVAERLRARGYTGALTLLGAEVHAPYDRPPLSKQVLRGERHDTTLRTPDELAALEIDIRPGQAATGLDPTRRVVRTRDGDLPYDVAIVATGAEPRRIPGLGGRVLRTVDDALALRAQVGGAQRVAVVGAGLIGCEVAATLRARAVQVALIDVQSGPMVRVVGPAVADEVARLHREHGVELHMSAAVARDDAGRLLVNDVPFEADVVVEAVGSVPITGWLVDSGLALDGGIVCDADGRASDGVYAVGDVARWAGVRGEHWTAATWQADHVSAVVLDQDRPGVDVPYWWSDQYDLKIQGLGLPDPGDDVTLLTWGPKARPVAVYARSGTLSAVVGFSAAGAVMRMRAHIAAGDPVDTALATLG